MPTHEGYALAEKLRPFVRVGMEHWRGPWFIPERLLLDYLLVHITSGSGHFSVAGQRFDVAPGDLIWIPPNTRHEMRGHPPRMLVAYIHFDLVYSAERAAAGTIPTSGLRGTDLGELKKLLHPPCPFAPFKNWCGRLPVANGPTVYRLMKQVIVETLGAHRPLCVSGAMLQLLGELESGLSPAAARVGGRYPAMQRAAQALLEAHEGALDLGWLARQAHLSRSHFRKLFREAHGESARRLHARARMQKACELILHGNLSMTQIARQLEFSTVHNFSRAFKRELGVSPRAYRQRSTGPEPA